MERECNGRTNIAERSQPDAFPNDPNEDTDADGDGVGANVDQDDNDPTVGKAPDGTFTVSSASVVLDETFAITIALKASRGSIQSMRPWDLINQFLN